MYMVKTMFENCKMIHGTMVTWARSLLTWPYSCDRETLVTLKFKVYVYGEDKVRKLQNDSWYNGDMGMVLADLALQLWQGDIGYIEI